RHPVSIPGYAILGYADHTPTAVLIDHSRWHALPSYLEVLALRTYISESADIWERGPLARKTAELQLLCLPYCAESVFPSTRHPDSIRGSAIPGYAGHRSSTALVDHLR